MRRLLLLTLIAGAAQAASSGITTQRTLTAAPTQVNLSITSPTEGTSLAHARADHVHGVTGKLAEANGGTGAGALTCTNQFLTSNGTVYSCVTATLASAQFANQGTTITLLHGNAAGNPSWTNVVSADFGAGLLDEAHGGTGAGALTCTNQFLTSNGTVHSCITATLASAQFANQGTTSSVLIGNAAGNPSWATSVPAAAENVQHDATLTGNGSTGSNLGIDLTHANTWTAAQTFTTATSNGTSATFNGNGTGNGANFNGGASGTGGTGANAYGINVIGGSATGAGVPGPGINTVGGTGAGIGAPGILVTGGASAGTNVAGTYGIFVTGGAASGNAAGTVGGLGGDAVNFTGGAGGPTATGTGGQGGYGFRSTGAVGGAASGAGTGGQGGYGGSAIGGAGGGGSTLGGQGGTGFTFAGGAGGASNGNGGDGTTGQNGLAVGTGINGDAAAFTAQAGGGSGTTKGFALRLTQSGTIKAPLLMVPMTSDPTALAENGAIWISGTTTSMAAKVRLNGITQPFLTGGVTGARAVQTVRGSGTSTGGTAFVSVATTVTLAASFPDTNYTIGCTLGPTGNNPVIVGYTSKAVGGFTLNVAPITAAIATYTYDCMAIHD